MEKTFTQDTPSKLKILRSGDPKTMFGRMSPAEILDRYGPPRTLLSSSHKTEKCLAVDVLARVLHFTPGVFCTHATLGCLAACLGHSSGHMQMPTHSLARDRRTALYLQSPQLFLQILTLELTLLEHNARRLGLIPAARLNGSSDLAWELLHSDILRRFPKIRFFDYTKIPARMNRFLEGADWPAGYHLTFSAHAHNHREARRVLEHGGTVAVVFWPQIPQSFWGFPVINGDEHDARFLDPAGSIVGLTAKGQARFDLSGFTVRLCPQCSPNIPGVMLQPASALAGPSIVHQCSRCGWTLRQRRPQRDSADAVSMAA
jgi:hypothetical protein